MNVSSGEWSGVWPDRAAYKNLMIAAFRQDRDPPGMSDVRPRSGPPTRGRLAGTAEERRTVHEADPADLGAAPGAGLALLPVDLQRAVEVAALAVHVHVEGVERGTAL